MATGQLIKLKAGELASGAHSPQETSRRISCFVRDQIPYYLDEWDVGAEKVLRKGQGMCAGEALLAAELHRAVGIPACFKIIKILGEEGLFDFVAQRLQDSDCSEFSLEDIERTLYSIRSLPPQRDHIIVQVFLDGEWVDLDLARDKDMDYGMRLIEIWSERKVLSEEGPYDSIDGWLVERMCHRTVTKARLTFLEVINHQIEGIRHASKIAESAGIRVWAKAEMRESLQQWDVITGCPSCRVTSGERLGEIAPKSRAFLASLTGSERQALEGYLVDWLYALVRHNIKRGRVWELPEVLTQRRADCFGYARLFMFLATDFGLEAGVVEVVQDNSGRYVPHYVCLISLADGRRRLIDPWYGSADVRHRLMVARVKDAQMSIARIFRPPVATNIGPPG